MGLVLFNGDEVTFLGDPLSFNPSMALDFTSAKQAVIAALQASRTPGASTVDGSNAQFSSDTQIANAILYGDAEVCNAIINSPGHPFLPQFLVTSSALTNGSSLPAACGVPIKVTVRTGASDIDFASTDVNTTNDTITLSDPTNELATGTLVQFTTSGTLPNPVVISTNYFVIDQGTSAYKFATTYGNALSGTAIDLTTTGSGNSTLTFPYVPGIEGRNADEMTEVQQNPELFGSGANKYYVIDRDGNVMWTSAGFAKLIYADFTLTDSPQAPSSYLNAVVAGALKQLYEDGGDVQLTAYYQGIFNQCLAMIRNQMTVIPGFEQR